MCIFCFVLHVETLQVFAQFEQKLNRVAMWCGKDIGSGFLCKWNGLWIGLSKENASVISSFQQRYFCAQCAVIVARVLWVYPLTGPEFGLNT